MNRDIYYNYIEKQLHILAHRIIISGKLNMLHLHLHSENFYLHFFNLLYGYNLKNLNDISQNVEAIDLIDDETLDSWYRLTAVEAFFSLKREDDTFFNRIVNIIENNNTHPEVNIEIARRYSILNKNAT